MPVTKEFAIENVLRPLYDDALALRENARNGDHRARRNYARAVFALIEALVGTMNDLALAWCEHERNLRVEQIYLSGFEPSIGDDGKVGQRRKLLSFRQRVRLILRVITSEKGLARPIRYDDAGWKALIDSQKVRNRMTHPKSDSSMQVTDEELKGFDLALDWLLEAEDSIHKAPFRGP